MLEPHNFWAIARNTAVVWWIWWSPIVAGFVGAFVVHLLTQSRERERWIADCKKQEFKELMTALTDSYLWTLRMHGPFNEEMERSHTEAKANALKVFHDRIYIQDDLALETFANQWDDTATILRDLRIVRSNYEEIRAAIVAASNNAAPKTKWQRLKSWKQ